MKMFDCPICGRGYVPELLVSVGEMQLCRGCAAILDSNITTMQDTIATYQPKANAATNPDEKIKYLHVILDALYEHKIKYTDKDVNVIEQDIEELIDSIIDAISEARI